MLKEEKMDKKTNVKPKTKNPVLAAIIAAIFPGVGFFYLENFLKGIAYIIIFGILIALEVHASDYSSGVMEVVVFGLLIAGFYIFQIIDSFNDARVTELKSVDNPREQGKEEMTLTGSVVVLLLGIIFLMINFNLLSYGQVIRLWPLILVGLGSKFIMNYFNLKKKEEGDEQTKK
jgi:TM2 domain-containing membrane protein YozV